MDSGMRNWVLVLAVVGGFGGGSAWAHGGGLDGYGCHHNRKQGGYHCHRGPLAGEYFSSQSEMLKKLQDQGEKKQQPATSGEKAK